MVREFRVEKRTDYEYDSNETENKFRNMKVEGMGLPILIRSATGLPSVDTNSLQELLDYDI